MSSLNVKGRTVRFGRGTPEDPSWSQGDGEWTHCEFGKRPDLVTAMRSFDAIETEDAEFVLPLAPAADAIEVATGKRPQFDDDIADETVTVAVTERGVMIDLAADGRKKPPRHFRKLTKTKFRQFIETDVTHDRAQSEALAKKVFCAKQRGEQVGWFTNLDGLEKKPKDDCRSALLSVNPCKPIVATAINYAAANSKELVKIPFKPELHNGELNWNAPQLAFNRGPGEFPTWMMVFEHLGKYLDQYLKTDWARRNNITTGRDFWMHWIATDIREPESRTTMISLVAPQESGKSFVEQMLRILTPDGVIRVDGLLRSDDKFDAELEGMPFCICDEADIADEAIFNRIKPWITDPIVWVRAMYRQQFSITNYTHWLQFTNHLAAIPVFDDTTRLTVIRVDHIPREQQIKTKQLVKQLTDEAPAFVGHLLDIDLPTENGRASIPAIETEAKAAARGFTDNPVNSFVSECATECDQENRIKLSEFTAAFNEWNCSQVTQKSVKEALENKGIKVKKRDGYDHVFGLVLKV
ncbi:MAG: hypothetical protein KDA52_13670 [Planctomycetaceae bacterium]|nr:hypothetical protein [Planctomycetaceae bacterium]